MNLGVFNRVNLKDSTEGKGMYSEWASLSPMIQNGNEDSHSVLDKFGVGIGKDVAVGVVKQLASNLGITQAAEPSPLTTDSEVQWCMQVICFGLTLPLSEHDTIKDCVNVYCEWLSALLPIPKICVPKPVCEDPNLYARRIISHFHNLFVPRKGEDWPFLYQELGVDTINRQAVLCHRVLRTLQQLAHESVLLSRETWEALLLFLLAINDTLLSPPTVRDDVADQLCERVLSVLFEVWLIACARCFPSPPLWKTLRESCMNWRHRIALIEQWNRINLALTARVLEFMYGPTFPELKIGEEDLIPPGISNDCIAQSWFRFLHCLGNPVSLCRPEVISQTPKFLQFAITSDSVMDPCQHPCLQMLPMIFLKAIKGIAGQVDAFLGIAQTYSWEDVVTGGGSGDKSKEVTGVHNVNHSPTPPPQRRLAKSFSVAPSTTSKGIPKASLIGLTSSRVSTSIQPSSMSSSGPSSNSSLASMTSLSFECRSPLAQARPKCNSILHLFGEWLFEAGFIGCENAFRHRLGSDTNKRPNSIIVDNTKSSLNMSQPGSLNDSTELPTSLTIDKYESGRAEAIGALCRVFCAKKTGEEILPVYLARFYLALQQGLKVPSNRECGETLVSILLNSSDLFRLDLDGVQVLIPSVISALEIVLPEKDLKLKSAVSKIELRRASIHLLLSMLVLPLHFQNLIIRELINIGEKPVTFAQLKPRMMNLLMNALQVESDPHNTHMLLGGLLLCVQDSSALELVEQVAQPDSSTETTSNLLSSVSDTMSMGSATTGSGNADYHSLPDEIAQGFTDMQSQVPVDSAHALFVRATYLVCHRLISSWKTDLNVSLAALELLSGLARIQIRESDALECKRAVKWLCDYIVYQCSRPPPAHSKDLHSTIVAAFQCCAVWLLEHPYLLQDKDCLNTVLEVVELGVSGTKSVGKPGEKIRLKDAKELKPASMRVRDAAENLLTCILEQVGYFPSECGAESLSSLLDEVSLLKHCNSWPGDCTDRQTAVERFRYFVAEGSIMLALLEEPLGNDQDPQPTITVLIRGPFGRHAWTMQLRHLPRHRSGTKYHAPNPGRPVPMQDMPPRPEVKQKYFPDSVERVPQCKVDQSIPNLDTVTLSESTVADETAKLAQLLERQTVSETNMGVAYEGQQDGIAECTPPTVCHEYQTARLFLSHFGFLRFDKHKENSSAPTLIALDSSATDFCKDLASLDSMSSRTCDTVHVFYVRAEQHTVYEIVSNVVHESTVTPQFLDFLLTLGWPVDVAQHAGWTGHISTSWRVSTGAQPNHLSDHGGSLFDGQSQVLYWAEACTEVAFVVPSQLKKNDTQPSAESLTYNTNYSHSSWYGVNENVNKEKPRTLSLDLDKNPVTSSSSLTSGSSTRRSTARHQPHPQTNTKIMVVWLESYEDHLQFPIAELLPYMSTGLETTPPRPGDCFVIFLHRLNSDLLRVHLQGPSGRMNLATPLVDGMVVSRRSLGPLVRQTALNMSRRRRLDNDTYQPPHVRRRLKVQEMVQKYKREMTEPELLTYLFSNP